MIQAFFAALAIPLTTAVLLMVALWVSGPRAPLVALLVNAFVLFEVAGCSRAVRLPMPAGYFRRSRFERRWIYELLGIRVFKRLMRSRAYRGINPDFRLSRGRSGFADLAQTMEAAEAAHALVFAIVSTLAAAALMLRWLDAAAWLMLFNVPLNAYPVMLQRYNRLRLDPLLKTR
jgi:Glycosyl-4,4'-diaponeurosporenoate acyltransferase